MQLNQTRKPPAAEQTDLAITDDDDLPASTTVGLRSSLVSTPMNTEDRYRSLPLNHRPVRHLSRWARS